MAELNPSPQPGYDPNYIFWSRPAREQPRGSKAGQITAEGIGKGLTEGVNAADQFVKNDINSNIYDIVDRKRSRTTGDLAYIQDQQNPQAATRTQPSTLAPSQPVVPKDVQDSLGRVQTIQSAKDAGKLTELQYWQRLTPELQANRTQFAGYREYYDRKTAEITGHNPANALMQSYMSAISAHNQAANAEHSRALGMIDSMAKDGDVNAGAVLAAYQKTGNYANVLDAASKSFAYKRFLDMERVRHQQFEEGRERKADAVVQDQESAGKIISRNVSQFMYTPLTGSGMGTTPQQTVDYALKMTSGEIPYNEAGAENAARILTAAKAKVEASIDHDIQYSGLSNLNPDWIAKQKEAATKTLDTYISLLSTKEGIPLSVSLAQGAKAIEDGDKLATLTSPTVGDKARRLSAWRAIAGNGVAQMIPTLMGDSNFTAGAFSYKLDNTVDMWGQAAINPDYAHNPFTIGTAVTNAKKDLPDKDVPRVTTDYLKQINAVTSKDTPPQAKANLFKSFFSPTEENRSLMDHFDTDSQYKVFAQLTNRDVTRYAAKQGGEVFADYKNTTEAWFGGMMMKNIIPSLIKANQDYYGKGSTSKEYAARSGQEGEQNTPLSYMWDTQSHQLRLTPQSLALVKQTEGPYYLRSNIMRSLARLNITLGNISHVEEAVGGNVDEYLFGLLAEEGITPDTFQGRTAKVQGPGEPINIGGAIMNAILAANGKLRGLGEDEETEEARRKAEGNKKGQVDVSGNQ